MFRTDPYETIRRVKPTRSVLFRDSLIFMLKLWLDGVKDVVLSVSAVGAVLIDLTLRRNAEQYLFYPVVRAGERFDMWLNLYGAAEIGSQSKEGLFAASQAGDNTLLGKLEKMIKHED